MPRESYRKGKRVAKRTLLNLSHRLPEHVEGLRGVLKGGVVIPAGQEALEGGTLDLYDVSSSYVEGRCCPLAKRGYNRDGKNGKARIVYGLLCAADGCPVAIEVFEGSTAIPRRSPS